MPNELSPQVNPITSPTSITPANSPFDSLGAGYFSARPSLSDNPNYLVMLRTQGGPGKSPITVVGNCPEQIGFSLQTEWESMSSMIMNTFVNSTTAGKLVAGAALNVFGMALLPQSLTAQVWKGTAPLSLSIPFHFNAYNDELVEVVKPVRDLIRLASPYRSNETGIGWLDKTLGFIGDLPGVSQIKGFIDSPGSNGVVLHAPGPSFYDAFVGNHADRISLFLGNAMKLDSVVIGGLQVEWDARYTKRGYPIAAIVTVELKTHYTYSREDYMSSVFPGAGGENS